MERLTRIKDDRRTLPTQDLVAKVKAADLVTVAATQRISATHFYDGLVRLRKDFIGGIMLPPSGRVLPPNLIGILFLPDGTPARDISVSVLAIPRKGTTPIVIEKVALTDAGGHFALRDIGTLEVDEGSTVTLAFRGANGTEERPLTLDQIGISGLLGDITLKLSLRPLPRSVLADLGEIVKGLTKADPSRPKLGTAEEPIQIRLGDKDCAIVFSHNLPEERYRYSVLVRLVEPRTSVLTETVRVPIFEGRRNFYDYALRNASWLGIPGATRHFAERVAVDQPISVDGFRDRIVGNVGGVVSPEETVPMAGTLGLGYLVHMGQQWTPSGLSLGDLLYSLPLAPGEQQRIAVFEQRQTLSTREFEALDADEQQRQRQSSESDTAAVFNSAFTESVRGASSFSTQADSSSWGVAGGIGAAIGPVLLGIGAGGGGGSSSSSGQSNSSLDGARNFTSNAASQAHSSVEREASARRHAQRTGIRLATASDVEQVTTKVITNNNRAHALTMQYWEVLRHFDVGASVDGVTLVCFVPLEVVRFLPPGAALSLNEAEVATRQQILQRYSQLLKHADILRRWIPFPYRPGLTLLEEFAGNPRAVPDFNAPTEEIIAVRLTGSFLPIEDIYVTVLTRRGTRVGPVRLSGTIPPLPDQLNDPTHVFATEADLFAELLKRRAPGQNITLTAALALPESIAPDDVIGFELSRAFRPLRYQLKPPADDPITKLIADGKAETISIFGGLFTARVNAQINGVFRSSGDLENELGGPSIWGFSAATTGSPTETYAANFISEGERLPMPAGGYPVAALPVRPLLRFNELLKIEQTLQHVVRNTVTYARSVWMSLTPEERAIMLEGYTIGVPADGLSDETQHIPLLNCIGNQVVGFYGNAMIMPFNIPAELSARLALENEQNVPFTTGQVQDALTQFHRTGFSPPVSHVTLPTRGVIGEAVLGRCPSAEKIDLTRFWNWADSPIPQAADIAGGLLNRGSTLVGATAPSTLTGQPSIIANITGGPTADSADVLKALIAAKDTRDLPDITGQKELATLEAKTLDTAEKARADALARAQTLASDGLSKASDIMKAKATADKQQQDDKKTADKQQQDDKKKADADAQKEQTTKRQTGITELKAGAAQFLAVADNKPNQDDADAYAKQIVTAKFGDSGVPLDSASLLFNDYRKLKPGSSSDLTQGSIAFLRALGLGP
jgi:hypothetical protein